MKEYLFTDPFDASWIEKYKAAMGENEFKNYDKKLCALLLNLEAGQCIKIAGWCKPQNLDLFMKLVQCFIMDSNGRYLFSNDYTQIKKHYD